MGFYRGIACMALAFGVSAIAPARSWAFERPSCPTGTSARTESSLQGGEYFCVAEKTDGSTVKTGPYVRWEGFQKLRERGEYQGGAREGVWTFYSGLEESKTEQGRYSRGKREGVWARWIAESAVELVVYDKDQELPDAIAPSYWKDIKPELTDGDVLCRPFQAALDNLRHYQSEGDPRLERATGVVVGCRAEAMRRVVASRIREQKQVAEAHRRRTDPKWLRFPMSAALCHAMGVKESAMRAIAFEYKKSKIAGVVNRMKLYELQELVVAQDSEMVDVRRAMGRVGAAPMSCSDKTVQRLTACYSGGDADVVSNSDLPEFCESPDIAAYLEVLPDVL